MSNRTVAEFDHDKAQEIADDPNRFVEAVLELLPSRVRGTGRGGEAGRVRRPR